MRSVLNQIIASRGGIPLLRSIAAFLEAGGDSYFQSALYRSSGVPRVIFFATGVVLLSCYGLLVNAPRWDFGKLLGVYVVLFFLAAQILAKVRFNQSPTPAIVAGGIVISFS